MRHRRAHQEAEMCGIEMTFPEAWKGMVRYASSVKENDAFRKGMKKEQMEEEGVVEGNKRGNSYDWHKGFLFVCK